VFFVISGYLIGYLVFSEVAESRFSIVAFYERRIRRIFPALFVMLAVFSVLACIYLLPGELVRYGDSMLAATVSLSNFYFWLHSGYFDQPTANPLLHTWSLGVEEQFYLLFPIFLVLVRRVFPARLRTAVAVLLVLSLAASAWIVLLHRETAFYMLYTRGWELLAGTSMALGIFPPIHNRWMRDLLSLAGIGLIAYTVVFYSQDMAFPGLTAAVPVAGTALIIGVGESGSSMVGSFLSMRPVVFVGLISYSLYLWHWPVIVVEHLGVFGNAKHWVVAAISLVLGILSWRFVEQPFRTGALRLSGRPLWMAACATMLLSIALSCAILFSGGLSSRFTPQANQIALYLATPESEHLYTRNPECFLEPQNGMRDYKPDICLHRDPSKPKAYLLIGDSHSAVIWSALAQSMHDANILQASATDCKPFLHPTGTPACRQLYDFIYRTYIPSHPLDGLFLEQRWGEDDFAALGETVAWAKARNLSVFIFGNVPEYIQALPRLLAYSVSWNRPALAAQQRNPSSAPLDAHMQELAADSWHVPYISLYQAICDNGNCLEFANPAHTVPLMIDKDHLSREGALVVVQKIVAEGKLP
jgi:peptidoglycan/LPS O-acetylase OafA/YrhL